MQEHFLNLLEQYGHRVWKCRGTKPPKGTVYIGRPSVYGSPYPVKDNTLTNRIVSVTRYYRYCVKRIRNDSDFAEKVLLLKDKNVMCHCNDGTNDRTPEHICHGLVLLAAADYLSKQNETHNTDMNPPTTGD